MRSMTGYGSSKQFRDGIEVSVEIKTVNHRFLDLNIKMPKLFNPVEDKLRKLVSEYLSRGHADLFISYVETVSSSKKIIVDEGLAVQYSEAAKNLAKELKIRNDFSIKHLMRIPEIVKLTASDENNDIFYELLIESAEQALLELNKMREHEGAKLREDISFRVDAIERQIDIIQQNASQVVSDYRVKTRERIKEALEGVVLDEAKLINEVAFYADKSDIEEEITRLKSHINQMKALLDSKVPIGRQADFLVQEFNREVNTICSKSVSIAITDIGLQVKNEVEKIREQVQNIE